MCIAFDTFRNNVGTKGLRSQNENAVGRTTLGISGDTVKNSANIRVIIREISRPFKSRHAWRLFASGLCIHEIIRPSSRGVHADWQPFIEISGTAILWGLILTARIDLQKVSSYENFFIILYMAKNVKH